MCNFHVGQRVACVDDSPSSVGVGRERGEKAGASYPKKGSVYTVRSIYTSNVLNGAQALLLEELDNLLASYAVGSPLELGFEASRFRPVVERKTDISIFKAMLTKTPEQVPA